MDSGSDALSVQAQNDAQELNEMFDALSHNHTVARKFLAVGRRLIGNPMQTNPDLVLSSAMRLAHHLPVGAETHKAAVQLAADAWCRKIELMGGSDVLAEVRMMSDVQRAQVTEPLTKSLRRQAGEGPRVKFRPGESGQVMQQLGSRARQVLGPKKSRSNWGKLTPKNSDPNLVHTKSAQPGLNLRTYVPGKFR